MKGSHKKKQTLSVKGALHQSVVELLQFVEVDDFSLEFSSEKYILVSGDLVNQLKVDGPSSSKAQKYAKTITDDTSAVVVLLPLGFHFSTAVYFFTAQEGPAGSGILAFSDTLSNVAHLAMAMKLKEWLECAVRQIHSKDSVVKFVNVSSESTEGTMNCGPGAIQNTKALLHAASKIRSGEAVKISFPNSMKQVRVTLKAKLNSLQRQFARNKSGCTSGTSSTASALSVLATAGIGATSAAVTAFASPTKPATPAAPVPTASGCACSTAGDGPCVDAAAAAGQNTSDTATTQAAEGPAPAPVPAPALAALAVPAPVPAPPVPAPVPAAARVKGGSGNGKAAARGKGGSGKRKAARMSDEESERSSDSETCSESESTFVKKHQASRRRRREKNSNLTSNSK